MSQTSPQPTARTVSCPTCGRPAVFSPLNPWRPFCTERCRSADLGAWASGAYRLPETGTEGMEPGGPES